jgi:hypothetical protein
MLNPPDFAQRIGRGGLPEARKRAYSESPFDDRSRFRCPTLRSRRQRPNPLLKPGSAQAAPTAISRPSPARGLSEMRVEINRSHTEKTNPPT